MKHTPRRAGDSAEKDLRKISGGRRNANSGALNDDGDLTIEVLRDFGFLVEVKTTAMDSSSSRGISISRDVIEKIERQALELFMIPAVIKKCKFNGINYITMRMDDFMDILNTIRYTKSHGV